MRLSFCDLSALILCLCCADSVLMRCSFGTLCVHSAVISSFCAYEAIILHSFGIILFLSTHNLYFLGAHCELFWVSFVHVAFIRRSFCVHCWSFGVHCAFMWRSCFALAAFILCLRGGLSGLILRSFGACSLLMLVHAELIFRTFGEMILCLFGAQPVLMRGSFGVLSVLILHSFGVVWLSGLAHSVLFLCSFCVYAAFLSSCFGHAALFQRSLSFCAHLVSFCIHSTLFCIHLGLNLRSCGAHSALIVHPFSPHSMLFRHSFCALSIVILCSCCIHSVPCGALSVVFLRSFRSHWAPVLHSCCVHSAFMWC